MTIVVRDEIVRSHVVVTVGHVDGDQLGTYGRFIGVRARGGRDVTGDRRRYGKCVCCRAAFGDDDLVHMVFAVVRNGKTVGNRLCCAACAATHATFGHLKRVTTDPVGDQ